MWGSGVCYAGFRLSRKGVQIQEGGVQQKMGSGLWRYLIPKSLPPLPLQEEGALRTGLTGCQLRRIEEETLLGFVMVNVGLHARMCV